MGVIYIESCFESSSNCSGNHCSCSKCNPGPVPFPPAPPNNVIAGILARLAQAEADIIANRLAIEALQSPPAVGTIRQFFEENEGQVVAVNATFDVVEGTVLSVGIEVVEILTASGDIVIIPFTAVITVSNEL